MPLLANEVGRTSSTPVCADMVTDPECPAPCDDVAYAVARACTVVPVLDGCRTTLPEGESPRAVSERLGWLLNHMSALPYAVAVAGLADDATDGREPAVLAPTLLTSVRGTWASALAPEYSVCPLSDAEEAAPSGGACATCLAPSTCAPGVREARAPWAETAAVVALAMEPSKLTTPASSSRSD